MKKLLILLVFSSKLLAQSVSISPTSSEMILLKSAGSPTIVGLRHSGTSASPTNTTTDDNLLNIEARGWINGSSTSFQSAMRFVTTQNWTNANRGNKIDIYTTKNNENTPYRRFTINHNGKVGVGNYILHEPDHQFEVNQPDDSDKGIGVYRYGGDAPSIFGISARGVNLLPNSTLNTHILARFGGKGHDGTDYTTAKARIDMVAVEDWTATETGAEMKFYTTAIDQNSVTEKMIIKGNGNVGIGTSDPKASLAVNGDMRLFPRHVTSSGNVLTLNRDGKSVIILDCTNSTIIGGLSGGEDGMVVHLVFKGSCTTTIKHLDQDVVQGNRIRTGDNLGNDFDLLVLGEGGATLVYDGVGQVWYVIGFNG
jgi:hypothetical protein